MCTNPGSRYSFRSEDRLCHKTIAKKSSVPAVAKLLMPRVVPGRTSRSQRLIYPNLLTVRRILRQFPILSKLFESSEILKRCYFFRLTYPIYMWLHTRIMVPLITQIYLLSLDALCLLRTKTITPQLSTTDRRYISVWRIRFLQPKYTLSVNARMSFLSLHTTSRRC